MSSTRRRQLSFDVEPHPDLDRKAREQERDLWLDGAIKVSGQLDVDVNLDHGDELIITIAGVDGEVLARHYATIDKPPGFAVIALDGEPVGYRRIHTAAVGDPIGD